jgi:hypothetical protein
LLLNRLNHPPRPTISAHPASVISTDAPVAHRPGDLPDWRQVGVISFVAVRLAEQTRIVPELKRRLSVMEGLESVVPANRQRASRLRQSYSKKLPPANWLDRLGSKT